MSEEIPRGFTFLVPELRGHDVRLGVDVDPAVSGVVPNVVSRRNLLSLWRLGEEVVLRRFGLLVGDSLTSDLVMVLAVFIFGGHGVAEDVVDFGSDPQTRRLADGVLVSTHLFGGVGLLAGPVGVAAAVLPAADFDVHSEIGGGGNCDGMMGTCQER